MAENNAINRASGSLTIDPGLTGDSWIQFDINGTGEWRMGVDDSDGDAFVLSQGSALGTTNTFRMSSAGERTMPLQPAFFGRQNGVTTNATGDGTSYTLGVTTAFTEIYDQSSDFTTAAVFTASVTGRYVLLNSLSMFDVNIGTTHTKCLFQIVTSNRTQNSITNGSIADTVFGQYVLPDMGFFDMDSADTAVVKGAISGGTKIADFQNLYGYSGGLFC